MGSLLRKVCDFGRGGVGPHDGYGHQLLFRARATRTSPTGCIRASGTALPASRTIRKDRNRLAHAFAKRRAAELSAYGIVVILRCGCPIPSRRGNNGPSSRRGGNWQGSADEVPAGEQRDERKRGDSKGGGTADARRSTTSDGVPSARRAAVEAPREATASGRGTASCAAADKSRRPT